MSSSIRLDPSSRIVPEPIDHFDQLPDSLLLLIFNKIGDVKALGRCCIVSKRFNALVPQVDEVVVRDDYVISDDDPSSSGSGFSLSNSGGSVNPKDGPLPAFNESNGNGNGEGDNGSIPESFYTNGGLKLRVVWTISSLIAASARHYLLQPIIAEHKTLSSLVLTDADGQGVLCMNKEQLEELRVKPLSASSASKRTLVPALNMRLWYAPHLDLPDGTILKGATLVAIRPSEHPNKDVCGDMNWVASAFEEPYLTAVKMLLKRRTYCLEMNSF